ncbi:hypothetical protein FALBO_10685 [Fusarium albosuccineum]|uniref:Apple domain-containing protein n=1 Tax=Fusarium albosuccineum TaxID=1237068 RepID=A0A8H4L3P7_9HYPO|nr:hypothetical protein FALBO_10685 [Fusarium albosuccineum]
MRSVPALVALALASSFNLVGASKCQPSAPAHSGTTTDAAPPSTTTAEEPVVITNAVVNGDFGGYDPSADGGIYAFEAGGDAKLLQGPGYTKSGSEERNCVQLKTQTSASGPEKRDTGFDNPWIQQKLQEMEPSDYTVRFWYVIVSNTIANTCRIEGFYGGERFGATDYFPVVSDSGADNWQSFVDSMPVTTTSGMIRFELVCVNGGSAEVYFDQVFVSNQVSQDNMDDISLFFPTSRHAVTEAPQQTSTVPAVDTSATTTDDGETSTTGLPTTEASSAETSADETSTVAETTGSQSATTSAAPTDPVTPSGKKICAKLGSGAAGRGCGKRPYNSTPGYKRYPESSITKEQCAALCLADDECQSFEWTYKASGCGNTCNLIAALWPDKLTNGASDAAWAYDRTCIEEAECTEQPEGTVCVNVNADTPAKSCTTVKGKAKACAKPFLTTGTRMYCGLSNECRDLCAKYPSCKSYAATFGSCSLYDARSSEVADAGSELYWFTDMDCHTCGEGNAYFNYLTPLEDPANMPEWSCPAETPKSTSTLAVSTTAQIVAETTTSADTAEPTSSVQASDYTTAPPSTTAASPTETCANGVPSPGICSQASPTPSSSTCGKNGWPQWIDAYGYGLETYPNQNTVDDCALICKQDKQCKAFGFDSTRARLKCMFSPELMEDAHFEKDATNAVVWNDLDCYNCKMCNEETKPTTTRSASPPDLTCAAHNDGRVCRYKENGEFPLGQNGKPVSPYVCWNNGKITKETSYSVSLSEWPYQHNVDQCVGICQQLSNCQASAWNRDTNRCEFISTTLAEAGYKGVEGSNVFWSDNVCWDCSNFCTDTSSEQSTSGTWTGIDPMTTQPPTTMLTSTRRSDDGEEGVSTSTDNSGEQSTSEAPTTTAKAPQAEPTDCAVPVASLSDDVTCGLPGAGGNQVQTYRLQNYVIKPVGSLAKCASICLQREDCQGFDYQKGSTVCYPYRIGPAGLGITYNPQSTDRFYDRGCFKCAS